MFILKLRKWIRAVCFTPTCYYHVLPSLLFEYTSFRLSVLVAQNDGRGQPGFVAFTMNANHDPISQRIKSETTSMGPSETTVTA